MKVALVLGAGTKRILFKDKVKYALLLYERGIVQRIVFSGKWWGGLKHKPKITEAQSMADYAVSLGLPRKSISLEVKSLNTIGNLYFSKRYILKPGKMFDVVIISNKNHIKKVKYLARKILGPKFRITYLSTQETDITNTSSPLSSIKKFFRDINDGDDKEILRLLKKHPYYTEYRRL